MHLTIWGNAYGFGEQLHILHLHKVFSKFAYIRLYNGASILKIFFFFSAGVPHVRQPPYIHMSGLFCQLYWDGSLWWSVVPVFFIFGTLFRTMSIHMCVLRRRRTGSPSHWHRTQSLRTVRTGIRGKFDLLLLKVVKSLQYNFVDEHQENAWKE